MIGEILQGGVGIPHIAHELANYHKVLARFLSS